MPHLESLAEFWTSDLDRRFRFLGLFDADVFELWGIDVFRTHLDAEGICQFSVRTSDEFTQIILRDGVPDGVSRELLNSQRGIFNVPKDFDESDRIRDSPDSPRGDFDFLPILCRQIGEKVIASPPRIGRFSANSEHSESTGS